MMKCLIKAFGETQEKLEKLRDQKEQNAYKVAYYQGKIDMLADIPKIFQDARIGVYSHDD